MKLINNVDFSSVHEMNSDFSFYKDIIVSNKSLFSVKNGFDLYFFKEDEFKLIDFSECNYFPNKLDRIIKSFNEMEKSFNSLKRIEFMIQKKEEIIKLLQNDEISSTEVSLINNYLNSMELEKSFYDSNSRMNLFIEDARKNLPTVNYRIHVKNHYKILDKKVINIKVKDGLINRPKIGNNIYLPLSKKKIRTIFVGHLPFPKAGAGHKKILCENNGFWNEISSSMVWIS